MTEKIIYWVDHYDYPYPIAGVVIICSPTGILCTVHAGGNERKEQKAEGFPIYINSNSSYLSEK